MKKSDWIDIALTIAFLAVIALLALAGSDQSADCTGAANWLEC